MLRNDTQTITAVPLLGCLDDECLAWLRRPWRAQQPQQPAREQQQPPQRWRALRIAVIVAVALFIVYESRQPVREMLSVRDTVRREHTVFGRSFLLSGLRVDPSEHVG